jgi:hypothetical protein
MSKGLFETVVDISAPGLPDKFPYLGCLPCGTRENTMDFVGAENSLRVQFATKQGWQYAQERALVRLSPPSRFLDRTFSTALRRAVIMEGQEKDCKVEYVTMHLEKGKLVFQNHDVPLYVWLPPVPEVAELAAGMNSNGGSENLGEFGLGYLLSALKDYLTEAGWVDEETLSIKKRQQDVRGQFLNKYHWFEHCNIPSHLFAVRGIAEFEHGVAAGFSCVEVQTNLLSHRSLVSQLENTVNQQEQIEGLHHAVSHGISEEMESQGAKVEQILKEVSRSAPTIKKLGDGYSVFLEWRKTQIQRNAASSGGQAHGLKVMIENASKALAPLIPPELSVEADSPHGRRKLSNIPNDLFCHLLLKYICGVDGGVDFFEKEISKKKLSRKMLSIWQKKVIHFPPVVRLLERIDGVADESDPDNSSW